MATSQTETNLQILLELLEREAAALEARDYDLLNEIIEAKQQHVRRMERSSEAAAIQGKYRALASKCIQLNRANGFLINRLVQFTQNGLNVLHGREEQEPALYNEGGIDSAHGNGHLTATA